MSCKKIKSLRENILSSGDDVAGAVNILCWVDGDEGMQRMCVCVSVRVGIVFN
jgi:hypothetical protein